MDLADPRLLRAIQELVDRRAELVVRERVREERYGIASGAPDEATRTIAVQLLGQPQPSPGFVYGEVTPRDGDHVRVRIGARGDRYVDAVLGRDPMAEAIAQLPAPVTGTAPDRAAAGIALYPAPLATIESSDDLNHPYGTVTDGGSTSGLEFGANPSYPPSNANDANLATKTASDNYVAVSGLPHYRILKTDLGIARSVNRVVVNYTGTSDRLTTLEYSSDGSAWTDTGVSPVYDPSAYTDTFALPAAVSRRYWRLKLTYTTGGYKTYSWILEWKLAGSTITYGDPVMLPAPGTVDGDDATFETSELAEAVRVDLGSAYRIVRARARIAPEAAGTRTYELRAATQADFSDEAVARSWTFTTSTGWEAVDLTGVWAGIGPRQYWRLVGPAETRRVHTAELYEAAPGEVIATNPITGLEDELDAVLDAIYVAETDHLADTVDAHDASAISIVDAGAYFAGSTVEAALQELGAGGGGASAHVFDVTAYGATGDGTTDDLAAINSAAAALNAAGRGVLYFPAGVYKVTGAITTITVPCTIQGDGTFTGASGAVSEITSTSTTANVLTITANGCTVRDLAIVNAAAGAKTAGAAIDCSGGILASFEHLVIVNFYDGVSIENSTSWTMRACYLQGAYRYGVRIRNTASPDAGDWSISDCTIGTVNSGTSGIRVESSGGGKITTTKINGASGGGFTTGIDVGFSAASSVLAITACSIENVRGDAVLVSTSGSGQYGYVTIAGLQVGLYSNNTGRAVKVSAASTGGSGVAGGIGTVVIDALAVTTDGTARAAIELVNTDRVTLGNIAYKGFNARYTSSGDTNTTDGSAPSFATPTIALGTAAAAGAASTVIRSDATIVAFDATSPTTQAIGDSAATGSAAYAARRDHKHAMPAFGSPVAVGVANSDGTAATIARSDHVHSGSASGAHYLVIADTHSTPIVFGDLVVTDDGADLVYTD